MWRKQYNSELYHYGVKGMKWGVRRYRNKNVTLSQRSPKIKDSNGDYVYPKGSIVGRYGKQSLDNQPMYLFTNEKDRLMYSERIGGEEQKFVIKKSIKTPSEITQLRELYKYTKDPNVLSDPFEYWKNRINQGGKIADGFFKHMKDSGYDALVDIRNLGGVADDPILLLNPNAYLTELQKK